MTLSDRIERTMHVPVPRERVWEANPKPEQLARWFWVVSAMDFRVGTERIMSYPTFKRERKEGVKIV